MTRANGDAIGPGDFVLLDERGEVIAPDDALRIPAEVLAQMLARAEQGSGASR